MKKVALRALLVVFVVGAVLWAAAPYLAASKSYAPDAPLGKTWTEQDLERWLGEGYGLLLLLWVPRVLGALLGILFLVQLILHEEKVRHGLLPPPDGLGPTVVATPTQALALSLLWPLGVILASALVFRPGSLSAAEQLNVGIATSVAAFLPPTFLTCLRRLRLGAGRIPRAPRAVGLGLRFLCIALLIVIPMQLLWGLALYQRGIALSVQDTVQKFANPDDPSQPWLIAVFGVFVAPFTEEGVFRGLLYPALRNRVPGGPFGAAVLVSLLFAAIHGSLLAVIPLFVLALVLTWVIERTNSLLACVVVHALHNALSLAPMLWRHVQGAGT
jgi:membrane protease YdiL (CAAX protease family)